MATSKTVSGSGAFPIAKADMIEGMAKGMAVLESFDTQRQRLNATLAAERAGITRAA
ncbi:MAG: IclR family transcriptional regulator, partial [Polaromonas sp.]